MYPWTSAAAASAAGRRAVASRVRTADEAARELADLRKLSEAESTFDDVLLSSKDRLAKGHVAQTVAEAATPEGLLELHRVWRDIDAVMGPGASVMQALTMRFPELRSASTRINRWLRQAERARAAGPRTIVLRRLEKELDRLPEISRRIVTAVDGDTREIRRQLQATYADEDWGRLFTLSADEVRKECSSALESFEKSARDLHRAAEKGIFQRRGLRAAKKRAEDEVRTLRAAGGMERRILAAKLNRLAEFGDPVELGSELARKVKKKVGRHVPVVDDIEDSAMIFMQALGEVASARPEGAKVLRRFAERGAESLTTAELKSLNGYLGNVAGLLPEAVATRMKFMEGIFYKNAFEVLADFPPALRGKMRVEFVEGALSEVRTSGPARQFGDGCMLLTGPEAQSAIIGLGEIKAGVDEHLLTQLFGVSDRRAATARVRFVDAQGEVQVRTLTRDFGFDDGTRVAVTRPPVYVYGRPGGESPEDVAKFAQMIEDQMQSGREVWKIQLPFSVSDNQRFSTETLVQAVNVLVKAKPKWGLP